MSNRFYVLLASARTSAIRELEADWHTTVLHKKYFPDVRKDGILTNASGLTAISPMTGRYKPMKLANFSSHTTAMTELFIIKGNSATGSTKQGGDQCTQACNAAPAGVIGSMFL